MGGVTSLPSDRVLSHSPIHAQYFTMVLFFLILAIAFGNALELIHFHYIPEAGLTCLIGMVVGVLVVMHTEVTSDYYMEELAIFDEATFALVLLPIIIFDAGFGLM